MPSLLLLLLLLLLAAGLPPVTPEPTDTVAMGEFAERIQGIPLDWNWNKGSDPCRNPRWAYVSCSGGRVSNINLANKKLSGFINPSSISKLVALVDVSLQNNYFSGSLPAFSNLNRLQNVYLGSNNFSEVPPGFLTNLPSLITVSMDKNPSLSAWSIPDGLNVSLGLKEFLASDVNLHGYLPEFFVNFSQLQRLRLSHNELSGSLPPGLADIPTLNSVDVTQNSFSGYRPPFRENVTFNANGNSILDQVAPPVPKPGLTPPANTGEAPGGSTPPPLPPKPLSPPTSPADEQVETAAPPGKKPKSKMWLVGLFGGIFAVVVVVYFCFIRKRGKTMPRVQYEEAKDGVAVVPVQFVSQSGGGSPVMSWSHEGMAMSYQALRLATGNFSSANIIGKGGFGVVYLGNLNGLPIAVKKGESDIMGTKGREEFHAEIEIFKKVKHRHLVSLLGYCVDGCERLLVYEYMSEGTLGQHLYGNRGHLTWNQRMVIALDVARGIEYLHSMAQGSFIHRDLKPSNILLDRELRAKVSDFGLVKLADTEKSMMTRLAGTFGYLAPEYALTGKVTVKVDVYAFGVILMEMIMGRKALDDSRPDEDAHLAAIFHRCLEDRANFLSYLDPTLDLDGDGRSSVFLVAELAIHCTARESNQRPDMGHAVSVLAPLVNQWKPSSPTSSIAGSSCMTISERLERWDRGDCTTTMDLLSSINGD